MNIDSIVLTNDSSLVIIPDTAGDLDVFVSYADKNEAGLTPGNAAANIAGNTEVSVVQAPSGATQRLIKSITVANKGAADDVEIAVKKSGVNYRLDKPNIATDKTWSSNDDDVDV